MNILLCVLAYGHFWAPSVAVQFQEDKNIECEKERSQ